jgi:hypothetical protein
MNEDALARAFDEMQQEESRFRPRFGDWLTTGATTLALFFILATADFHAVGTFTAQDVRTFADVFFVIFAASTAILLPWWAFYAWAHRHSVTGDEMVARLKKKAQEQQTRRLAAERKVGEVTR